MSDEAQVGIQDGEYGGTSAWMKEGLLPKLG